MPEPRGRRVPPEPRAAPEPQEPPFYVAKEPLPYSGPGAAPVFAYTTGDHVSPEAVEEHNWGGLVEVPDQFKGVLAPPTPPTDPGGEEEES